MENDQKSVFLSSIQPIDILQGNISSKNQVNNSLTLDEPVIETIKRDLFSILKKINYVLFPRQSFTLLQQWDLWGPLIFITILAIFLQSNATNKSNGIAFAEAFSLMIFGAIIITINSKLLGGKLSIFQSICALGYCLLPLLISAVINNFLFYMPWKSIFYLIRLVIVMLAFIWTMFASVQFFDQFQQRNRRALILYPIFLFYFLISWLIILHIHPK